MRVVVAGGTGFIGRRLVAELAARGHEAVVAARPHSAVRARVGAGGAGVAVDPLDARSWAEVLAGADAVVNLAGATIGARWTAKRKRLIRESRVDLTRALVEGLAAIPQGERPGVLLNASGAGYYGDRGDDVLTEVEPPGQDWLAQLAAEWEAAALAAEGLGVRVVPMRTGIVFAPGGGSLPLMALPFRLFVGGPLGSGRQWVPWVHLDDIAGIYAHAIERADVAGPLNACAGSSRQRDVVRAIGRALGRPSWFPTPLLAVRLVFGEFADALGASQRVSIDKLRASGYQLRWPDLDAAVADALGARADG